MRIVMLEPLGVSNELIEKLSKPLIENGHEFIPCFEKITNKDELLSILKDADVLIVANSPVDEDLIKAAENLKMISVAFTGIDHLPINILKQRNITVSNAQGYSTDAVAELTIGLIISLLRNVIPSNTATKSGKTRNGLIGNELLNKTVGIIGTGAIGLRVAEMLKVFGCNILAYSRTHKEEVKSLGIKYVSLEELLSQSDIVSLHTPLTEETKSLINKARIKLMKSSSILINCARGPIIDSEALADALNNDEIAGAGIDVFETEPPISTNHPLLNAKNIIVTPHIAFATKESIDRRAQITFENIYQWLNGTPQNIKL